MSRQYHIFFLISKFVKLLIKKLLSSCQAHSSGVRYYPYLPIDIGFDTGVPLASKHLNFFGFFLLLVPWLFG